MDLVDRINNTRFLGKEFLTWLWFKSDTNEGLIKLNGDETVELWFDDKLVLAGVDAARDQNIIKTEAPTESAEAQTALLQRKKVSQAKLRIVAGQRAWSFTIAGDTLALSGVRIPAILTREEDDQLQERLYLIEELNNYLLALYRGFVELRLDKERWASELTAMRAWVHETRD